MAKKLNVSGTVLGLMSGTSLDGLDMALCRFSRSGTRYNYEILKAHTYSYNASWKNKLLGAMTLSAEGYFALDAAYGRFVGEKVSDFLAGVGQKPDAIASHGHTVFHQPAKGFSTQLGSGAAIAATTGISTICDFRSLDVALGGQGAPLVPVGDKLLFGAYQACLNIGGISNISFDRRGKRVAYDIGPANMLLNYLAGQSGKPYDKGGRMAASGETNAALLKKLDGLKFYKQAGARSLGREWFEKEVQPLFDNSVLTLRDQMATACWHAAAVIARELEKNNIENVLVTGGGAYNTQLVKTISLLCDCDLIVPHPQLINFKEALVFAFLGYLRLNGTVNTLASVTGAKSNSAGGVFYLAK